MPPAPGMIARRVSGRPTTAVEAKRRKVDASASSRPPPSAIDEMAEIVGMGRVERRWNAVRREWRKSFVL